MNDEELIERIVALNYREFGASAGNDLKRIIIKKENELDKYKNIVDELERYIKDELILDFYNDDMPCELIVNKMENMIKKLKGSDN